MKASLPRFLAVGVGLVLVAGCTPKASEFDKSAERLLEDELAKDPGGTWTVDCAAPGDIDVDTIFSCTATDGTEQRTFTGRITSRSKYVLTADAPAGGTTTTAPPADTTPTTVAG